MEPKRFRISQDGNEYAMAIKLLGERVKLECVDSVFPELQFTAEHIP